MSKKIGNLALAFAFIAVLVMGADLKEKSTSLLSSTTVAFDSTGQTTLYTVPAGKTCVVTHAVIVIGGDAGDTDITIGVTSSWDNWAGANGIAGGDIALDNMNAANDALVISPTTFVATPAANNILQSYAAGSVIKIDVIAGNGNATNNVRLFGFLF